jgi:hypothetical protein
MPARSAPFSLSVPANSTNTTRQLVFGNEGAVYRVFNSTDRANPMDKKFRLSATAAAGSFVEVDQDLHPTMSIDVSVGPTDNAVARPIGIRARFINGLATPEEMTGAFELIRGSAGELTASPCRSGRFNFPKRVPNAFLPVRVVDLTHSNPAGIRTVYRFHNTGENSFEIFVAADKAAAKIFTTTLGKKQSIDIELTDAAIRKIFVARVANDQPISGVFDLVG